MRELLSIILLVVIFSSCKKENSYPMAYVSSTEHINAEELALNKGDTIAYNTLSMEFFDSPNEGEFFYTALIMANKYNYSPAYYDAYMCLTNAYHKKSHDELDSLDPETRKLALELLFRGAKVQNKNCIAILDHQYITRKQLSKNKIKSGNNLN